MSHFQKPLKSFYGKIVSYPEIQQITQQFNHCRSKVLKKPFQRQQYIVEVETLSFRENNQKNKKNLTFLAKGYILVKSRYILNNLNFGDKVFVQGYGYSVHTIQICKDFNYQQILKYSNIDYLAFPNRVWITSNQHLNPLEKWGLKVHLFLDKLYSKILPNQELALIKALVLGKKNAIQKPLLKHFQKAGLSHILALSGLHVGLIAFFFFLLLSFLGIPRKIIVFLTILILIFYVYIVGSKPSILRAVIMFTCGGLTFILDRDKGNYLNSLFLAALIILLYQPIYLFHLSFQLSFLATLGILLYHQRLNNYCLSFSFFSDLKYFKPFNSFIKGILSLMILTLSAQIFILPILIHSFHGYSLIFLLSNIPIVLLTQCAIALSFLLPLFLFFDPIFQIYSYSLHFILNQIIYWATFFSKLPIAYVDLKLDSWIFSYYIFIPILLHYRQLKSLYSSKKERKSL